MIHLKFTITLPPKAQMRSRSRAVSTDDGKTFAMNYKAGKQRKEERKLEALLYEHRPAQPIEGQVWLGVKAYLPIPTSKPKKWKADAAEGLIRPTTKPDLDNLLKQITDCLTGIMWIDDKQVVGYLPGTGKYYAENARWEVEVVSR